MVNFGMSYTKDQRNQYMETYRSSLRLELQALLGSKCAACGVTTDLEFDHINPGSKKFTIASGLTRKRAEVLTEVAKCQLLCRNCHLAKSISEGSLSGPSSNKNGEKPWQYKHSDNDVTEMVRMKNDGMSLRSIARTFNTTHYTVKSRIHRFERDNGSLADVDLAPV